MSIEPLIAGEPQFADDVGPVAVAEAGRAHEHERLLAEDAVLADHVPAHGRVLAVDVEEFRAPICGSAASGRSDRPAGGRAPIRGRDCRPAVSLNISSQASGLWAMFQSPVAQLPSMAQFSKAMLHALVGGALGELAPDLLVARQAVGQRLAAHAAGEAGDAGRRRSDGRCRSASSSPAASRGPSRVSSSGLPNMPSVEMVMSRSPIASRELAGQARKVLAADRLPEERLEAFEAVRQDLRAHRPAGSGALPLIMVPMRMSRAGLLMFRTSSDAAICDAPAGLGALDRAEDHGQALDVVVADRLGRRPAATAARKSLHDAEMAADRGRPASRGGTSTAAMRGRTGRRGRAVGATSARMSSSAVPEQRAARADDAPRALPAGAQRLRRTRSRDR